MIDKRELLQQFPDHKLLEKDVVKVWVETIKFKHYYYILLGSHSSRSHDLILSSRDEDNEAFATSVLLDVPHFSDQAKLEVCRIYKNDYGFQEVVVVPPTFHSVLEGAISGREHLFLCVPAYSSEFSGNETKDDFVTITRSVLPIDRWQRDIQPKILLRFDNSKTKSGTKGDGYALVKYDLLVREIQNLSGVTSGFIEVINYKNNVIEILAKDVDTFSLIRDRDDSTPEHLDAAHLISTVWEFLTE